VGFATQKKTVSVSGSTVVDFTLEESYGDLSEVTVTVGSRNVQRTKTTTPLPVDVLSTADLKTTGQVSFDKALQYRVPSFNTVNTPVNDATSLLDPYEIRNMGPSRSLILINGKRKNASSLVYVQTSPGRGEGGADISAIPNEAIDRVEILRDGASAQYGSDAIAGVMNIILKGRGDQGLLSLNTGITHKGDGQMIGVTLNNVANIGSKGFLNYTVSLSNQSLANRPGKVDAEGEASDFGASMSSVQAFLSAHPDAGNINGQPATAAARFLINGGLPLNDNSEIYFNTAYIFKKVNSFANYRTPYWRPTDYGLLTPSGQPYQGYVPTFEGDLNDYHGTLGVRSNLNSWLTDMSFTFGGNRQMYTVANTINRGLRSSSPILFKPGGYDFRHIVGNIDATKRLSDKVSLGLGSEFRSERFEIIAGDTASYLTAPGADSFPGFPESSKGVSTRFNFGGYVDLGWDITDAFLLNGTVRLEKYSDVGTGRSNYGNQSSFDNKDARDEQTSFVWKLSSRYKVSDNVIIRGSASTGFRAPSLHQINLQLAQASFVPGQGIQIKGIVNNRSAQAKLLGVPTLKPEKSTNLTFGLGLNPVKNLSITLDYYRIKLEDRIILSSEISAGGTPQSAQLDAVLKSNGIVAVSFFTNGINTITSGLDFVAGYRNIGLGSGRLNLNLAGNYQFQNELDGGLSNVTNPALIKSANKSVFDFTQEALLLSSRPEYKIIVGGDYNLSKVSINLNNTVFGPTTFRQNGLNENLKTKFKTKIVTDLGSTIKLSKNIDFGVTLQNLFNVLPEWEFKALNAAGQAILNNPAQLKNNSNLITFNQRYDIVTYDGSHFSQLGLTFAANLSIKF
jgi:iron complex outermembrane receptor protein